jgi:hypothetical protein
MNASAHAGAPQDWWPGGALRGVYTPSGQWLTPDTCHRDGKVCCLPPLQRPGQQQLGENRGERETSYANHSLGS